MPLALQQTCNSSECLLKRENSCDKILPCGCYCCGIRNESSCLPCLKCELRCADEYCPICGTDRLCEAPCIQNQAENGCRHIYHYECIQKKILQGSSSARISFTFRCCPADQKAFEHPSLQKILLPIKALESRVHKLALDRLIYECRQNDKELRDPDSPYFNDQLAYAMVFIICSL
jgi:E3 ubiquitin-protein ligase MYCBP2